jgi:hypothetical protein
MAEEVAKQEQHSQQYKVCERLRQLLLLENESKLRTYLADFALLLEIDTFG